MEKIEIGKRIKIQCNGGGYLSDEYDNGGILVEDILKGEKEILIKTEEGIINWNTGDWVNKSSYRTPIDKENPIYFI